MNEPPKTKSPHATKTPTEKKSARAKLHLFTPRYYRYYLVKVLRSQGSPHYIARGVFCGVMAGLMVPVGQIFLSLFFAFISRSSKAAAPIATFISNPITYPIFWSGAIWVGSLVLPVDPAFVDHAMDNLSNWKFWIHEVDWLGHGLRFALSFILGGTLIGLILAPPCYIITLRKLNKRAERRRKKHGHHETN